MRAKRPSASGIGSSPHFNVQQIETLSKLPGQSAREESLSFDRW